MTIIPIEKVRAALAHAEQHGAQNIEDACAEAAQVLAMPIEAVREVAYQVEAAN